MNECMMICDMYVWYVVSGEVREEGGSLGEEKKLGIGRQRQQEMGDRRDVCRGDENVLEGMVVIGEEGLSKVPGRCARQGKERNHVHANLLVGKAVSWQAGMYGEDTWHGICRGRGKAAPKSGVQSLPTGMFPIGRYVQNA